MGYKLKTSSKNSLAHCALIDINKLTDIFASISLQGSSVKNYEIN